MFVADSFHGQGMGQKLLDHLIDVAHQRSMSRLSLETGASDYFEAARSLYLRNGFRPCPAFADLPPHDDSVFITRVIPGAGDRGAHLAPGDRYRQKTPSGFDSPISDER